MNSTPHPHRPDPRLPHPQPTIPDRPRTAPVGSNHPAPPPAPPPPADERGPGVFLPQHVIVTATCITLGTLAALLIWLAPTVWAPISAGIAVAGLTLAIHGLWHGRHHP